MRSRPFPPSDRRLVEEYRFRFRVDSGSSSRPSELLLRELGIDEIEESLRAFLLRLPSLKTFLKVGMGERGAGVFWVLVFEEPS